MGQRIFAAIVPPPEIIQQLDALIEPRRSADPKVRWQQKEKLHVTTCFIAASSLDRIDSFAEELSLLAARTSAFEVTVGGGGAYPDPATAKILYLGIRQGTTNLEALSRTTRAAASRVGLTPDGKRYSPHLTMARGMCAGPKWLEILDSFGDFTWQATELLLFSSDLYRYTELDRWKFN